jgi:hypothetical protein
MGFDFSGFVLRAPRTAPSNATTTDEATNGVDRDFKPLSPDYAIAAPSVVEVAADQYRASTLLRPEDGQTEYLVWAANTGDLSEVGGFLVSNEASVSFPTGSDPVFVEGNPFALATGSNRAIIVDDAERSINAIVSLIVRRGDTGESFQLVGTGSFNPVSGVFTVTDATTLAALGGGLSSTRGDRATEITCTLSAPVFWWSRNDARETRFKWDGRVQRWRPLRGTPPRNLGMLLEGSSYTLSPAPSSVAVGAYLPGNSANPDSYCSVRIGSRPDASSIPVAQPVSLAGFGGLRVVTDDEAESFDFAVEPTLAGVVGQGKGRLVWNPAFVVANAGQTIFYTYSGFVDQEEVEALGGLEDANVRLLFIAPLPAPTDYPFIRIGSRQPLEARLFDSELLLSAASIQSGQVGVALSTGRLKFASEDVARADPDSPNFDVGFLGASVFYDGVSLTQRPVPLRQPVQLVNGGGDPTTVSGKDHQIYIPDAMPTPSPGASGVLHVPDGTGLVPNASSSPGIRPGGSSGLVRAIEGPWDLVLFSDDGQISTIRTFDDGDEIPKFRFRIPRGTAYVDLREGAGGSEVILGREDLRRFDGRALYFLQSGVQPSVYAREARMYSRVRDSFILRGDEVLVFYLGGAVSTWDAAANPGGIPTSSGGTFTASQIAQSLSAVTNSGAAVAVAGRVVLQTNELIDGRYYGDIEIGFGPGGTRDLSGPAALGFLPGWKIRIASPNQINPPPDLVWLPDNGSDLGVFRSPFNLDGRRDDVADVSHRGRFDDVVYFSSIPAVPVVLLDNPPLEDVAGYDEGVFFRLQDGLVSFNLQNYREVLYQFGEDKFSWADVHVESTTLEQPTNSVFLGEGDVIPSSFRLPSNNLSISLAGAPLERQSLGTDFLLPDNGEPGQALLVDRVGSLVQVGGRGVLTAGSTLFIDNSPDIDFVALGVRAGYQLKVTQSDAKGVYIVAEDATDPHQLRVQQQAPVDAGPVPWDLYDGVTDAVFDPGIVADAQYVQFNHLPDDPFQVRVLSPVGALPTSQANQNNQRLVAVLGDALASGRALAIRFGQQPGSQEAAMVALQQVNLGEIVNSGLDVPAPESERFANNNFEIRVGSKTYTFAAGDLIKVAGVLSFPLAGDIIEVQTGSGTLNFGSEVFAQFEGQDVIYVETFLTPNLSPVELPSGKVEYRVGDGALNFSALDMQNFGGVQTYLVEQMIAAGGRDVTLNPIQGSFLFTTPLRALQIVEVHYFQAEEGTGNKRLVPINPEDPSQGTQPVEVTEQLPLFVRQEQATPASLGQVSRWEFNPTDRTIREDIEPALYVGSTLYNVGSSPTAGFDLANSVALLAQPVVDTSVVRVTYAVIEAFGGEQTYSVSQPPVYRPPFRIEEDRTSFTLAGDRTGDLVPGKLLRVGEFPFYLTSSTYDASSDTTTVGFLPRTQLEAGSRDPGSDSLSLLSDRPLSTVLSVDAHRGFWVEVLAPYDPVNRGFQSIFFNGDLSALAVAGHLLELGDFPFVISGSEQSDDGTRTRIDITSFFPTGFAFGQDAVKISARPLYQPLPMQFIGLGGIVESEGFELVLFGETSAAGDLLPGKTLRPSVDYQLSADDGAVELLNPPQGPLLPMQSLYLRHTRQRAISPVLIDGVVLNPRVAATFVHVTTPTEDNNRLGKILRATYTFANPDTFYYRSVPLLSYLGEVSDQVTQDIASRQASLGPSVALVPPSVNYNEGRLGLKAQLRNLEDTDRAARVFLEFYNEVIAAFEQVEETITGNIFGDRDGKFKFFVGRGRDVPPPGYEDAISGKLNPRNLFSEVFFGYNPSVVFLKRDPLVDPTNFSVQGDQLEGAFIDPDFLADLQSLQRELAANDVDDVLLVSRTRKKLRLFPLRLEAFGRYRRMGEPSVFSRLFPEQAFAFTLTDPGIGADLDADPVNPGVYAFRKRVRRLTIKGNGGQLKIELPKRASTFLKPIGDIGNPVLGQLANIGSISVQKRQPRARVYRYSPVGFPEIDDLLIGVPTFSAVPRPAVIATPLPLHEFPIGEDGMPDFSQLASQGGGIIDLTTGDPDLFTPQFRETDADRSFRPKITFGRPDGRITDVQTSDSITFDFPAVPGPPDPETFTLGKSVFVGEILLGCIVTFAKEDHTPGDVGSLVLNETDLLDVSEDPAAAGSPVQLFRGDTVFVTPTDAEIQPAADIDDPGTNSQKSAQLEGLPGYRVGFDLGIENSDGEYRDITLPSFRDPSIIGLKEILGQRPPTPMSYLEAEVRFRNALTQPAPIPALLGGYTNDSGDYSLPYLYAQNTEIDQLGIVQSSFQSILSDTGVPSAAYPDEVQGVDGQVLGAYLDAPPAALLTSLDATPVASSGLPYVPNSGVGDVAPFDLLLVETGQDATGLPTSSQGILSIGRVSGGASGSVLEPPRFVSPTTLPTGASERIRYRFRSAMSFVNRGVLGFPPGMVVRRVGTVTQFDISQVSNALLVFNDGTPAALSGGLNNIFSPAFFGVAQDNVVVINLWTAPDLANPSPVYLQSVIIAFNNGAPTVSGDAGGPAITTINADDERIYIDTPAPFVTIAANPGLVPPVLPDDPSNPGNTIPLWFTIDIDTSSNGGIGGASTTGFIEEDRLTLNESFDLRTVVPRDTPNVDGVPVFSELEILFVASQNTDACTVNDAISVNGGDPFTFLARGASDPLVGDFDPAPLGSGRGSVRVMAFEGAGNTPIVTTSSATFSALPSSSFASGSVVEIARGRGIAGTATDRNFRISSNGVAPFLLTSTGSFGGIQAGDICVVSGSSDATPRATTKAGTYLIKHVVEPNNILVTLTTRRELVLSTRTLPFNIGRGWANVVFPTLVSSTIAQSGEVEVSSTTLSDGTSAWSATGTLYFVAVPDPAAVNYGTSNFRVDYLNLDSSTNTFVVSALTAQSFDGSVVGAAAIVAIDALPSSAIVSGFVRIDVRMDGASEEPLPRNTVGYDSGGSTAVGFRYLTVEGTGVGSGSVVFTFGGAPGLVVGAPAVDEIGVRAATPISNLAFVNDPHAYVYEDVPQYIELNLSVGTWNSIHAASATGIVALLPGDSLATEDATQVNPNGFLAQAGVFLEPSWPRPTLNLVGNEARVVDASHSVAASSIGFRDGVVFGESAVEGVTWEVRRIRRFHEVLRSVGELLGPLRYVYETRRGTVSAYGPLAVGPDATVNPFVVTSAGGTQLGAFNDELVNINPGDSFRLLAADGTLLDEVEIGGIESATQIWLKAPGVTAVAAPVGLSFEIYLRQVPVPHEQSNAQLLEQITQTVLLDRRAVLAEQVGGVVPTGDVPEDPRRFQDTDKTINFAGLGVQVGDLVLIDPAGALVGPGGVVPSTGVERGARTFGDRSVPQRVVATPGQEVPYLPGAPAQLDDNRGWYRVTAVAGDALTVSSRTEFSSDPGGDFVVFGDTIAYAVLPTISGSTAPFAIPPGGPGVEGQMDLRPTAFAGTLGSLPSSFLGNNFSIAPFSYRVLRPSPLFSEEAVDLVLLMRERTLSFLEEFRVFFDESKFGSYFVFQRDRHVGDLGNPLIPDEGKGVMSNELIDGVRGLVHISPFANTTDGLSVLDRRFWVNDFRLDSEFPPGAGVGTPSYSALESNANNPEAEVGDGRPVLTDRIEDVLDNNDQFRELRYAWLDFRVNRETGTLEQIERFERELPKKRREELRQLRLAKSVEDSKE